METSPKDDSSRERRVAIALEQLEDRSSSIRKAVEAAVELEREAIEEDLDSIEDDAYDRLRNRLRQLRLLEDGPALASQPDETEGRRPAPDLVYSLEGVREDPSVHEYLHLERTQEHPREKDVFGRSPTTSTKFEIAKRWSKLGASLLSAAALGALTMRFMLMPSMEAVRSNGTVSFAQVDNVTAQRVPIFVEDAAAVMRKTTEEAARVGLDFSVKASTGRGYDLVLLGLVPYAPQQQQLKATLGLPDSSGGALVVEVRSRQASR